MKDKVAGKNSQPDLATMISKTINIAASLPSAT
jgi:hypothetical protein